MRILFLIPSLERGGAERQLVELAKGLRLAGHEPQVAVFYEGGALEAELAGAGVPVRPLKKAGRWDPRFLGRFVRLLHEIRPDVLHSYMGSANLVAATLRPLIRGSTVVWGVRSAFMDMGRYDWLSRLTWRLEPLLSGRPAAIIV